MPPYENNSDAKHNIPGREIPERENWPEATPERLSLLETLSRPVILKYAGAALGMLVLLFVALYLVTAKTLPGTPLYTLKVSVLEEIMPFFRFSAASAGEYRLTLMERRVYELTKLERDGTLNAETFNAVLAEITEHKTDLNDLIAKEEDSALSKTESLVFLREYATYARAAEQVLEANGENSELEEMIEDVRSEALNYYEEKVDQFVVKADPAELKGYLDSQLNEIASRTEGRELSPELQDDVEDELDNVAEALTEADAAGAITAASDALRYVVVADILADFTMTSEDDPGTVTDGNAQGTATDTATATQEESVVE